MWATPSPSTNRRLLVVWATFATLNVILMWLLPGEETVPFHFVWISLALVYGFTQWRTSGMVIALAAVGLSTGLILAHHAATGEIRWEETTEEPLMAAIFVVMVWHVHRRQLLLREVQRVHGIERRRMEREQLFVRLASHELRTPITVARGYTELIRGAREDDDTVREDTAIVLEELDKVASITQRLVTLMQLDEPYPLRRTDVDAELLRIVHRWQPAAERNWSVQSAVGAAPLSPERFEAALDCLLENAVKFSEPGDRIEVLGRRTAGGWSVQVSDSGVGISPEVGERLRHNQPDERTRSGTGLGLAIVRAVIERLDGQLTITGNQWVGTTVTIHIPQPTVDRHELVRAEPAVGVLSG
jgi:two-component system OmpR family sensor kinase